jgi:hypothetical protein
MADAVAKFCKSGKLEDDCFDEIHDDVKKRGKPSF